MGQVHAYHFMSTRIDDGFVWMSRRPTRRPASERAVSANELRAQITALKARLAVISGDVWDAPVLQAAPEPTLRDVGDVVQRWLIARTRHLLPQALDALALLRR